VSNNTSPYFRIEVLSDFRDQWSAFVSRLPPETPFQTPEWLITWWEHFGSGCLRVMVFRQDTRIVGVMPLFLHEWNGRRQLTLIGSGMTDYLDPVFEPECIPQIVDRLGRELNSSADWDICDWQDLSVNTPLASVGATVEDTRCGVIAIRLTAETERLVAWIECAQIGKNILQMAEGEQDCGHPRSKPDGEDSQPSTTRE
jgi:hypothetical protein